MFNVIDLFAGAGGLSLGFQQTQKYNIKVAFENNPAMQATYRKNHPGVDVRGDVCGADYAEIQREHGKIDIVIGGPPCQGFSNANRQRNHAISQNNALVKEYIRAILEIKPKAFVMENVSMLRSDVHKFYLTENDLELVNSGAVEAKSSMVPLLDEVFVFEGVLDIVQNEAELRQLLWNAFDYLELNIIYKADRNQSKLSDALEKHEKKLRRIAQNHLREVVQTVIERADHQAFSALLDYYNHRIEASELKPLIEPAIMYQRMLSHVLEILTNQIIVDEFVVKKGLYAEIRSFAVIDYLKAMLTSQDGENGYSIASDVLNAADFGAPQKRMRFVMVGIRKDISQEAELPKGILKSKNYRTVFDAISDLEEIEPIVNISDDVGIPLDAVDNLSELARELRDTNVLKNHIITNTTDVAMDRFKALRQGDNFHTLDDQLKTNTYTDVSRTQNTIYMRLAYDQPSGTVVNVRKSMWVHPVIDRAVSVREAARLQTFPDSFEFVGTKDKQYQQVGNAVPPILAKNIAQKLADQLKKGKGKRVK